jgi:hypothetical protein
VNDLQVSGPTFSDSYHEQRWSELSDVYPQRWRDEEDNSEENSCFCWAHYLDRSHAEKIGIAATGKSAIGRDQDYPEWLPKKLAENEDALWVHSDRIQTSYSSGSVVVKPSADAWIAVGCGSSWDPSEQDPEDDVTEDVDWDDFPADAGPLLRIEISAGAEELPAELEALLPYWQKLFQLV